MKRNAKAIADVHEKQLFLAEVLGENVQLADDLGCEIELTSENSRRITTNRTDIVAVQAAVKRLEVEVEDLRFQLSAQADAGSDVLDPSCCISKDDIDQAVVAIRATYISRNYLITGGNAIGQLSRIRQCLTGVECARSNPLSVCTTAYPAFARKRNVGDCAQ